MKQRLIQAALAIVAIWGISSASHGFESGDKLVTLSNLHPDMNKRVLYTMNYQLPSMIPMCSEVVVVEKNKKKFVFAWNDIEYTLLFDKHTKKAGVEFDTAIGDYFGRKCDKAKVSSMSKVDQKGIRIGQPQVGMTRQGILYAMGRPPRHANPDIEAYTYMYWLNRFKRKAIDFNEKGIVEDVRL